jgi:hypothetical protein
LAVGVEQGGVVVGEQAELLGLGGLSDGLRRVHDDGWAGPPVVGAEQVVEGFGGAGEQVGVEAGGEIAVECGEGLAGAGDVGHLEWAVEAGEPDLLGGGPAVVVCAHPAYEVAVARGGAPAVAEAVFHGVVEGAGAGGDVVVDDEAHQAVGFEADGAVALVFDEVLEELVADVEEEFFAVGGFAEGEQARPGGQQFQDAGGGEWGHSLNGIVELTVETLVACSAVRWGESFKTMVG